MNYIFSVEEYFRFKAPKTLELIDSGAENWRSTCPFCNKEGKFYVHKSRGIYWCFYCEQKGTMVKYHAHFAHLSEEDAYAQLVRDADVTVRKDTNASISLEFVEKLHQHLLESPLPLETIQKKWMFSMDAIIHFKLGFKDGAVVFPVFNKNGACVNLRFKKLWPQPGQTKIWNYVDPQRPDIKYGTPPRLYPSNVLLTEHEIWFVAGEKDLVSTWSAGIHNVLTNTHGEATFPPNFAFELAGKIVHICLDRDRPGMVDAKKAYDELKHVATVDIVMLPEMPSYDAEGEEPRKDLTDFWKLGKTKDDLLKLIDGTKPEVKGTYAEFQREDIVLQPLITEPELEFLKESEPNIIDLYTEYSFGRVNSPKPFHRLCGLWLISNLLGRNCVSVLGNNEIFANLFCFLIGRSTKLRKSSTTEEAKRILQEVDEDSIGTTSFTPQGLLKRLSMREDQVTTAIYFDEISMLFDQIKTQDFMAGTRENLIKLMNCEPLTYDKAKEEVTVKKSYVTMLGSGVPSRLAELLSWKDIESGFLIRFLVCMQNEPTPYRPMASAPTAEEEMLHVQIVNMCKKIRKRWNDTWSLTLRPGLSLLPAEGVEGAKAYKFIMNDKAIARWNQFDLDISTVDYKNDHINYVHSRLPMLIRKLSVIYAAVDPYVLVFGNTVEVNLEHMLMAIRDINEYRQYMVELVNTVGLTEPEKHVNSIIEMIYRHPRITRHEIAKELKIGKKDMDSALATCLDRGAIRQNKISEDNVEFLIATA